jgi:hypothetical protein
MQAQSFFENSPKHEITIYGTPREWQAVVLDLIELRRQVHYYRSASLEESDHEYTYELATSELIEKLEALGVNI